MTKDLKQTEQEAPDQDRVLEVAEKVKSLLIMASFLIDDLDLIEAVLKKSEDTSSFIMSSAPILLAFGINHEEKLMESELRSRRSEALKNLIVVLKETEEERQKFKAKQNEHTKLKQELLNKLGL